MLQFNSKIMVMTVAFFNIAFACYLVNGKEPRQVTFDPFGAIRGHKLTDAEHTLKARLIKGTESLVFHGYTSPSDGAFISIDFLSQPFPE